MTYGFKPVGHAGSRCINWLISMVVFDGLFAVPQTDGFVNYPCRQFVSRASIGRP